MSKSFLQTTTPEIDSKLAYDVLRHNEQVDNYICIIICILIILFQGFTGYWLKFGVAIPCGFTTKPIDIRYAPVQKNYTKALSAEKTFEYVSLLNKHKITLIPQASYELSGLTVAKNHDFFFVNDFFDSAALYDLGASWGELGNKNIYKKYFKSYSSKTEVTGSRILWTQGKTRDIPYDDDYVVSHFSHSHLVPANRNIMAALLKLNRWDKVKIEGELIDMAYTPKNGKTKYYYTSMSRNDRMPGDRDNGNCETVYVTKVQIGHFIYK